MQSQMTLMKKGDKGEYVAQDGDQGFMRIFLAW